MPLTFSLINVTFLHLSVALESLRTLFRSNIIRIKSHTVVSECFSVVLTSLKAISIMLPQCK